MSNPIHETLIGRTSEAARIRACLGVGRNVLLEGPVGVGKTVLALSIAREIGRPVFRIDGDSRYSEQKLTGWFDPPAVIRKGYGEETFVPGPLVEAMRSGGILFINELNRLPEGVQNVLLPAIDERMISIPRLGVIQADPAFRVIATQNPKEFVATSHLSEAILDRFELSTLDYQSLDEEREMVSRRVRALFGDSEDPAVTARAVSVVRATRAHPRIKRGASVRAAMAVSELAHALRKAGSTPEAAFLSALQLALPTRIELVREVGSGAKDEMATLLQELAEGTSVEPKAGEQKKKS